jgi:hypothetical protein
MKNAVLLIIIGILAHVSNAQPKPNVYDTGNQWAITAYDDTSPVHTRWATQTLCFMPYGAVGTTIQGVWYSTSFPNWRGRYDQEGDRILMHGEWTPTGHDGMVIELFAGTPDASEGAGQWTEWLESSTYGSTIAFANTRLRRTGKCIMPGIPDASKASRAELEKLAVELSGRVKPRLRKDGKPAQSPMDAAQLPYDEKK